MQTAIVKPSRIQGLGVFAARDFAEGDRILRVDESRLVTETKPLLEGEDPRHCDYLADGRVVLLPPPERHRNHSCDPNAFDRYVNGCRYLIARRAIPTGDEITGDYCINGFGEGVWECNCASIKCRKVIHADFFHLPRRLQREYLPYLADWYKRQFNEQVDELAG